MIKSIPNTNDLYTISSNGTVMKRIKNNAFKPVKVWVNEHGYSTVVINGKREKLHRLVALAFIPNPNNYPQVNHKDGDKQNNDVTNLEWCTQKQNMSHANAMGLTKQCFSERPLMAKKNGISIMFKSISAASKFLQVDTKSIRDVLADKFRKTCKGYTFKLL